MKKLLFGFVYRVIRLLARLLFPGPELEGLENIPDGPCVIVGNHAQMYGPVYAQLYLPFRRAIWCNAEMMHLRQVPDYAFQDFWSSKPRWCRWFYRLLSYLIAPLSVCVFNSADCIGVYRDSRLIRTMRSSLSRLSEGANIVIFPESYAPYSDVVWKFQDGFVGLAQLYYRQTGEPLRFVPMYVAPKLRRIVFGAPVTHDPQADPKAERERVCRALMDAITGQARGLPRHRVIPYPNMPRRDRPFNRAKSASPGAE